MNFWGDQYCKPMESHFSEIVTFFGSTDNRDQVMNALRTVQGHNNVINEHELRQIVRGQKHSKANGTHGIPSKVNKLASERLQCTMSMLIPVYAFWKATEYPYARSDYTTTEI